jgi:tetratricopeptide (TPR) repeat protein
LLIRLQPPRPEQALELLDSVHDDLKSSGSEVDQAYADTERARAHLQLGSLESAAQAAESARSRLRDVDALSPVEAARADAVLALVKVSGGDQAGGIELVNRAATILHDIGASRSAGEVWRELGEVALQAGDVEAASAAFRRALDAVGVASAVPVPTPAPSPHRTLPGSQTVETAH